VAGTTQAALYWSPSTDNVGVAGYNVFRDGVQIAQTTLPNYLDTGLAPGTSHVYSVRAFDAAGNLSAAPRGMTVKTVALSTAATGTLAGVVFSAVGKPVANVVVTLTGNGLTKIVKTSSSGVYKFTSLPVGTYTLTIAAPSGVAAAAAVTAGTPVVAVAGQTVVVASSP
jgi:cellulose 1,4-beta-cellobiosidase